MIGYLKGKWNFQGIVFDCISEGGYQILGIHMGIMLNKELWLSIIWLAVC